MSYIFYDPWTDLCRVESQLRNIQDQIHEPPEKSVLPVTKGGLSDKDDDSAVCAPFRSAFCKEGVWWPAVDLKETKDGYELHAELPGVRKEDVCIELHGQGAGKRLVVSGKKEKESEEEGARWHRSERSFGAFERTFTVPADTVPEDITAKFGDDGVLVVSFPKPKAFEPVKIEIQ